MGQKTGFWSQFVAGITMNIHTTEFCLIGVDYSIKSPGFAVYTGTLTDDKPDLKRVRFFTMREEDDRSLMGKKFLAQHNFDCVIVPRYDGNTHRWLSNSTMAIDTILKKYVGDDDFAFGSVLCAMEGYAYSASGLVFNLAEAAGAMKMMLFGNRIPFQIYPPTTIKKAICGKGNGNKTQVREGLEKIYSVDFADYFGIPVDISPSADLVDAMCMLHYLYGEMRVQVDGGNLSEFVNERFEF